MASFYTIELTLYFFFNNLQKKNPARLKVIFDVKEVDLGNGMKIPKLLVKKFTIKKEGNIDINVKDKVIIVDVTGQRPQCIAFSEGVVQEYRESFNSRGSSSLQEYAINIATLGVKATGVAAALV